MSVFVFAAPVAVDRVAVQVDRDVLALVDRDSVVVVVRSVVFVQHDCGIAGLRALDVLLQGFPAGRKLHIVVLVDGRRVPLRGLKVLRRVDRGPLVVFDFCRVVFEVVFRELADTLFQVKPYLGVDGLL